MLSMSKQIYLICLEVIGGWLRVRNPVRFHLVPHMTPLDNMAPLYTISTKKVPYFLAIIDMSSTQ